MQVSAHPSVEALLPAAICHASQIWLPLVLVVSVDTDDEDDCSGLKAVKVIGALAVPSASREPPFKMTRAGAPPPSAATGEA